MKPITELATEARLVFGELDERQRRHVAALISMILGHGGRTQLVGVLGIDYKTIVRGREDLENQLADCPEGRIRRPGAGRPSVKKNA